MAVTQIHRITVYLRAISVLLLVLGLGRILLHYVREAELGINSNPQPIWFKLTLPLFVVCLALFKPLTKTRWAVLAGGAIGMIALYGIWYWVSVRLINSLPLSFRVPTFMGLVDANWMDCLVITWSLVVLAWLIASRQYFTFWVLPSAAVGLLVTVALTHNNWVFL